MFHPISSSLRHGRRIAAPPGLVAAALALVLIVAAAVTPARAQLFGGGNDDSDRRNAEASLRMNQMEGQMRALNGQVEQLSFQVRQLQDTLTRLQKDYEFRLQELENGGARGGGGGGTGGAGAGAGAVKPQKKSDASDEDGAGAGANIADIEDATGAGAGPAPLRGAAVPAGRGAPPADLGQLPAGADPIGGIIGAAAPMNLGAPGTDHAPAPETVPVPGVDPRYATMQPTASPRDEYDAAYGYILNGEYDLAEQSFKTFMANHPTDRRLGAAQFWLGESYAARSRNKEAADAFLKSYTQFPDGPKAADSLLKLGLSLSALGEKKAACASWDELLTKYPKASKAIRDRAAAEKARGKC